MKSTGVLRRLDGLGRIVIPKEIRNKLKLKNGESMEIFINEDAIVLKKYSYMSDLHDVAQNCSDSFYDVINNDILITDLDKVIAASGSLKKKYLGKDLGKEVISLLNKSHTTTNNETFDLQITDKLSEECYYVIASVVVSGAPVGSVIILSKEKIDDLVEKCASFIAKFLSKHLE